ncbi:hypothetical protein C6N75_08375 [Streptomyces solincola]|uniref:Uncharacterized protein n=1 Tax=Streptomyces solincola TaxID=2100817 RepID=A0A2S9PZ02_9ACTN|nr:hypothetical protein [Streptomyces solincola]PRH79644.1 hypothetical protein C6N75_08375 [Streptomyces solincola]
MHDNHTRPVRGGIAALGLLLPSAGSLIALIVLPGLYGYGTVLLLIGIGLAVSSVLLPTTQRTLARVIIAAFLLVGLTVIVVGVTR